VIGGRDDLRGDEELGHRQEAPECRTFVIASHSTSEKEHKDIFSADT
jgi:hypothetical protein